MTVTRRPDHGGVGIAYSILLVGLLAVVLGGLLTYAHVAKGDGGLTGVLRVGEYAPSRSFVEATISDPTLTDDYGHDGQQFYVIAATFPDLADAEGHVDDLQYRARRIAFPALLSPLGDGRPLIWGMIVVNLAAIGAGAMAVGLLAVRMGLSPFLGLSVAVTPALLESSVGGLADALAFALAVWGVVLWRRHIWVAVALFTVAALARETSLVVPFACLLVGPRETRLPLLIPPILWAVWAAAVALWLPSGAGSDDLSRFGWPFHGWAEVGWQSESVLLGIALIGISLLSAIELKGELPELAAWLVLDAGILVMVGPSVVGRPLNFARVAAVAVPAGALAIASYRRRTHGARLGPVRGRA